MTSERETVRAAHALQPLLHERADEIEAARRLPADISQAFGEAGFYGMLAPIAVGGLEISPADYCETIEVLARADGSAAWCAFIGATSGSALAVLPEATAKEIFAKPGTLLCGVFAPRGEAAARAGGFVVNGRWQWGSGTQNADWILGGCRLTQDGAPMTFPGGAPRAHMVLVPKAEVKLLDTWYASGLCGTGSTDFAMENVTVPEEHVAGYRVRPPRDRPLYAFPQFGLLALGIAGVALGLARTAIDELIELAGGKTPTGSSRTLARRANTQAGVAEAEGLWRSARAFLYEAIDDAWQDAQSAGEIASARRRDVRIAATHATRASARAVDLMYDLGGGSSVYRSSPLQRAFRDVHVATQHMMVGPGSYEVAGRMLLGDDTGSEQF